MDSLEQFYPVFKEAEKLGIIFSGHWELNKDPKSGKSIPEVKREVAAISYLEKIIQDFPKLKIVVEHATTQEMLEFVKKAPDNVAATLTVHHALLTYQDVFDEKEKIKNSFNYCKPVAKSGDDRQAVVKAMVSGNKKFFFGSDSAPHNISQKIKEKPAAGIFSAPVVLPLLCQIFEKTDKLDMLENFVSKFGAEFYGLPLNQKKITLKSQDWKIPLNYEEIPIFKGGETLEWQIGQQI